MPLQVFYVTAGRVNTTRFLAMGMDHLMMSAYAITKQGVGAPKEMALLKDAIWILDSGMISAWRKRDLEWMDAQDQVVQIANEFHPTYVSHLDLPVERHFLQMNNFSKKDALEKTYWNARQFLDSEINGSKKIFVLQGWDVDDYRQSFDAFEEGGIIDACRLDGHWLGIGTMCLRKPTQGIFQICEQIREWTQGIHVHVFGVGQESYQKRLDRIGIDSTDTASFMLNNMVWGKGEK